MRYTVIKKCLYLHPSFAFFLCYLMDLQKKLETLIVNAYGVTSDTEYVTLCNQFIEIFEQLKTSGCTCKIPCLFVEGNIAAGKSTLLASLSSADVDVKVVQEPIEMWQRLKCDTTSLFELYNSKLARTVFLFQIYALATRHLQFLTEIANTTTTTRSIVAERSIFSDRLFFNINREWCTSHEITSCTFFLNIALFFFVLIYIFHSQYLSL